MKTVCFVLCLFATVSANNLLDLVKEAGATSLLKMIKDSGFASTLTLQGPFTLFAPIDDGIAMLPRSVVERLLSDKYFVIEMLRYHMVSGHVYLSQLSDEMMLPSLYFNGGKPVNIRINTYRSGYMKYAEGCEFRDYESNKNATNGVLHLLENVMYPFPLTDLPTLLNKERGRFSNLTNAISMAFLQYNLTGGPMTMFAPTNAAFYNMPYALRETIMNNYTALREVMTYHLVQGSHWADTLRYEDHDSVKTWEGHNVTIKIDYISVPERVTLNDARIVEYDIAVTNGVIQVIDQVLLPPQFRDFGNY